MKNQISLVFFIPTISTLLLMSLTSFGQSLPLTYPIVDTGVSDFYDNASIISAPSAGDPFYGQDATYMGNVPSYTDNGDGTVTDNVTGLMWQQNMGSEISYDDAFIKADTMTLGGHTDWRVPTIKELYSLILFTGRVMGPTAIDMFIDTLSFDQPIGDTTITGVREIDAQTWSSTQYVCLTMAGDTAVFGVNFVDGRIKGYPKYVPPVGVVPNTHYFRMVRGNTSYGINDFTVNTDSTISDHATGLMWQQADDGMTRDWEDALDYAENLTLGGYTDWRLPNAKELHSIVDYTRCRDASSSAAIDPLFLATSFNDPDGVPGQYGHYWTGSPHLDGVNPYETAVYIAFGEAQGEIGGTLLDVHGAGAQRSDPKTGLPADYPKFFGMQNDLQYVFNYVRCVRNIPGVATQETGSIDFRVFPNPAQNRITVSSDRDLKVISIYNSTGEMIREWLPTRNETRINTTSLANGIYFIRITAENGTIAFKKVVIAR